MVHFIAASLDNITQVAAYVLNDENADETKLIVIVDSTNLWCKRKKAEDKMVKDLRCSWSNMRKLSMAMQQNMHSDILAPLLDNITNLVECK